MRHQKWDKVNFNAGEGQPKTGFVPFQGEGGEGGPPWMQSAPFSSAAAAVTSISRNLWPLEATSVRTAKQPPQGNAFENTRPVAGIKTVKCQLNEGGS